MLTLAVAAAGDKVVLANPVSPCPLPLAAAAPQLEHCWLSTTLILPPGGCVAVGGAKGLATATGPGVDRGRRPWCHPLTNMPCWRANLLTHPTHWSSH